MAYAVVGGRIGAEPAIRFSGRKDSIQKIGTSTLQDARLPCNKRRVYAAVGGRIGAEPTIRFSGQKGVDTKSGILTLQDARSPCDKRMAYAVVGGGWTLSLRLDSSAERIAYKNGQPDFAGCPFAMRQTHGLCYGRRGAGH